MSELLAGSAIGPEQVVTEQSVVDAVRHVVDSLDARTAEVLRLRYGLDGGETRTLEDVAHILGMSRERVRQIETRALARLRLDGTLRQLAPASAP